MKSPCICYNLDFLTNRPSFYVFGHDKVYTKGGLLLSIIILIISFCFSVISQNNYCLKKNVNIVYYKKHPEDVLSVNLSDSFFMVKIENDISPKVTMIKVKSLNISNSIEKETILKIEKCNLNYSDIPEKIQDSFIQSNLANFYCLTPGQNIQLSYNPITNDQTVFQFEVLPCDINYSSACGTQEYIEENFDKRNISISFFLEGKNINHYNNTSFSSFYKLNKYDIHYEMETFTNVNLLLHSYTSDEGIIFENKLIV